MSNFTTAFGKLLQQMRSGAALSQEELAEQSGLSRSSISDLERGLHPAPRLETVRMLAQGLQLSDKDRQVLLAAARPALWQGQDAPIDRRVLRHSSAIPRPLTSIIGRESEVVALRDLLQAAAVRLVTVTGPGGVGKTRLAIAVAEGLADDYPDLTSLGDPELVIPTVAAALGVRAASDRGLSQALTCFLAGRRILLVLDNCERVLPVAPTLTELLATSPFLTVFATSRQPFRVRGEHVVALLPLPLPALHHQETLAAVAANPAVALFTERAVAVNPEFALCAENAGDIAAICRRLDGLPLAIELAAARTNVLTPNTLVARLESRLRLLGGGGPDLPDRQRSMRETIAWSYDLLSPDAQMLFRRIAVFVGGFAFDAAEAVANHDGRLSVFDGVSALVDQSLLRMVPGPDSEPRFFMLETLREFGVEQLHAAAEADAVQQAHAAYFTDFAQRSYLYNLALRDSVDRRFQRIEADHANIVLALTNLANARDAHGVACLAGPLGIFWQIRGYLGEGRAWLEWALARGEELPTSLRCRVLASLSSILWAQGNNNEAATAARNSLRLAEQVGDTNMLAYAIHVLGLVADSLQQWLEAEALFSHALRLWRELGVRAEEAVVLRWLSRAAYALGDHALSTVRAEAALSLSRELGHADGAASALGQLARLARDAGNTQYEVAAYQEALRLLANNGNLWSIGNPIAGLAGVAAVQGQTEIAARLVGAFEGLTHVVGSMIRDDARDNCARAVALALDELGEQRVAELLAAGRAMRVDEAVALAEAIAAREIRVPRVEELSHVRREKLRRRVHRARIRSRGAVPKAIRRTAFRQGREEPGGVRTSL